ncbi:hypothetical protein F66182_7114 [Fusarium sp. NRRL 66182]|nr:hypothetical protein F66182_7114 [Fusarium sp. NRRL 66182]
MASKRFRFISVAAVYAIFVFYLFQSQAFVSQTTSPWRPSDAAADIDWSGFAYTQYVTNREYLCNSLMIFDALHRLSSRADRVMMVPFGMLDPEMVNSSEARLINKARDEYNVKVVLVDIQTNNLGDATWADSYTKLLAFNQTQYSRVLSIDSDALLLQSMDELFLLPSAPVAMPQAYWMASGKALSSHVMLIEPSSIEFSRIMHKVKTAVAGEYDMEIVNQLYRDTALVFPHRRYALLTGEFRRDSHAPYLGSDQELWDPAAAYSEAKLIHFSDWPILKPWEPLFDEQRLAYQPNCVRTTDGVEDCTARRIWNSLYSDFKQKRKVNFTAFQN